MHHLKAALPRSQLVLVIRFFFCTPSPRTEKLDSSSSCTPNPLFNIYLALSPYPPFCKDKQKYINSILHCLFCIFCKESTKKKVGMGFLELLEVASMPIVQVLLISVLGALLATDYCSLLSADTRRSVNKVQPPGSISLLFL